MRKKSVLQRVGGTFSELFTAFREGDWKTRLSFLIFGFGCILRGQIIKGLIYLAVELFLIYFVVAFGWQYISLLPSLGTRQAGAVWNEALQINETVQGDNSMLILFFGVTSLFVVLVGVFFAFKSARAALTAQRAIKAGRKPNGFIADIKTAFDSRYHTTVLTLPSIGVFAFTLLPVIFMICMAFTNFDRNHQPPGNLFTWVGLDNFSKIFYQNPQWSKTFVSLLLWTLVWAVFATFTNYIFGMLLAFLINKKGVRLKKMWRTMFVMTIAVPQFVSLMLMGRILHDQGPVNLLLLQWGWIQEPIRFLSDGNLARITVIIVNMWVGIPYTILITTGILMNIPEELYESARIDGANPFQIFLKITLPYMFFVTTPYLITQFTGNINNFNVIYFLTGGGPATLDYFQAGKTDLLVTWLYKLTVNEQNYSLASTLGILIFVLLAVFTLVFYNRSASVRKGDDFS